MDSVVSVERHSKRVLNLRVVLDNGLLKRETGIRGHNLSTTAEQVVMVWACAAKRRQ